MTKRIIILFGLLILLHSCKESNTVQPVLYETFIELGNDIHEIIIDEDCLNIKSYDDYIKFSTSGNLIEVREIKNTNYGFGISFNFIKGGYLKVERFEEDLMIREPARFAIHQYSYNNSKIRTDTLRTLNSSLWCTGHLLIANNYDFQNDNKIGVFVEFNDMPFWTTYLKELFSKTTEDNFQRINSYPMNHELTRYFHDSNLLYAYKDVFLFFGNSDFAGEPFYIIYPDGTYYLAHSKENRFEDTEVFEYSNKLYANYKSKYKCRLLSSSDLKNWSSNNLNFSFDYLGVVNSMLLGKVNKVVGKLDLADNKFYELNSEYDFSDCMKIIEYKGFTYFIKKRQIVRIESSKITFESNVYKK